MKKKMYTIHDELVAAHNLPFFAENDNIAIRQVRTALATESSLSINASDYKLYCIGEFDDSTGAVEKVHPIRLVQPISALKGGN